MKNKELESFTYQGKLEKDVRLDFGNRGVTLEAGVEYVIIVVKKASE